MIVTKKIIELNILKLLTPLVFRISNSCLSFKLIKKNFVVNKNINGKISNNNDGTFNKDK